MRYYLTRIMERIKIFAKTIEQEALEQIKPIYNFKAK